MKMQSLSKYLFGAALLCLGFLTSCNDKKAADAEAGTTTSNPDASATSDNNKATAQVNPAHGLPGHRCDIPVGAPLNSAAATQSTPATQTNTVPTNVSPIRVDKSLAVNPPHGEPGHDCAVPVGAPLK